MRPILTIWEITNPNPDLREYDDRFFRWTFQYYGIFVTNQIEYKHGGHCERRGLEWVQKHGYKSPEVVYDDRTNVEFLA